MKALAASGGVAAALVSRHQELAARVLKGQVDASERARLIGDIVAAGAAIAPGAARDALRDLLYFWVSDQNSRGERALADPLPSLAPFAEAAGVEAAPAVAIAPLSTGAAPVTTVAGMSSADLEREARARAVWRIGALGRQWRQAKDDDERRGYLLTGKALNEASLYEDDDPVIKELVQESRKLEDRNRTRSIRFRVALLSLLLVVAVGVAGVLYYANQNLNKANQDLGNVNQDLNKKLEEKNKRELDARSAVDKLTSNGDPTQLKDLLREMTDASPDQLAGLTWVKPPGAPSIDSVNQTVAESISPTFALPTPPAPTSGEAAPQGETCSGYLWFGSAAASRLADGRDPEKLKARDKVTLVANRDTRLRSDWPNDDTYAMSAQKGLVPGGATVILTSDPKVYPRPSQQVWAQVGVPKTFCTTAYLQFVGDDAKSKQARAAMSGIGVQAPPAERLESAKGLAEVRYYDVSDRQVSQQVADALKSFNKGASLKLTPLLDFPRKPPQGTIEVWLDLGP